MKHSSFLLFLFCLALGACGDQKDSPLSATERKLVSQGYADTVRILTPIVDSTCQANKERIVSQFTDSLYKVRIADLNRQRKRFQQ